MLYKFLYVLFSRLAEWARKKAGVEVDQHDAADDGTKKIKDASEGGSYEPVDPNDRPDDDIFDNDNWP